MQDKIIAAIAAYLEGNNLELFQKVYASRVHSKFVQGQIDYYKLPPNQWPDDCVAIKSRREDIDFHNKQSSELIQSIATEIAAAIAPLVDTVETEPDVKVDRDELYTEKFKEWREKYFIQQSNKRRFISKSNGVLYDDFGLEQKFKRSYDESAIKQ